MVKYAFGFPVVAMVSHIPVKSRIAGNDVTKLKKQGDEMTILFAQQTVEMKEWMVNLLRQLDSQMATYSILPTEFGDCNPGPSR